MSQTDPYQKYVTFDVRAHYNYKDDTITLTSKDPDVAKQGFRVKLSKNTKEELRLRQLLKQKGVIRKRITRDAQVITMIGDIRGYGVFRENSTVVLANHLVEEFQLSTVVLDMSRMSDFNYVVDYAGLKTLTHVFSDHEPGNGFVTEDNVLNKVEKIPGSTAHFLLAPTETFRRYREMLTENIVEIIDILKNNFDRVILSCDNYGQEMLDFLDTVPYTESDLVLLMTSENKRLRHLPYEEICSLNSDLEDCVIDVSYVKDEQSTVGDSVSINMSGVDTDKWSYKKDDVFLEETRYDGSIVQYTPLYHYDFFAEKHAELAKLIAHYQV